jgi:hypothetical protein
MCQSACILSAWIGNESSAPLLVRIYPAHQAARWLDKELGIFMSLELHFADEKTVTAVVAVRGLGRVAVAENRLNRDGVNAVGGNDQIRCHYRSVCEGYGWSIWVLCCCYSDCMSHDSERSGCLHIC